MKVCLPHPTCLSLISLARDLAILRSPRTTSWFHCYSPWLFAFCFIEFHPDFYYFFSSASFGFHLLCFSQFLKVEAEAIALRPFLFLIQEFNVTHFPQALAASHNWDMVFFSLTFSSQYFLTSFFVCWFFFFFCEIQVIEIVLTSKYLEIFHISFCCWLWSETIF